MHYHQTCTSKILPSFAVILETVESRLSEWLLCIHGKSLSGIYISVKDPTENKPPETRYYRKEQCTTALFT
jgi:hypothetical protein